MRPAHHCNFVHCRERIPGRPKCGRLVIAPTIHHRDFVHRRGCIPGRPKCGRLVIVPTPCIIAILFIVGRRLAFAETSGNHRSSLNPRIAKTLILLRQFRQLIAPKHRPIHTHILRADITSAAFTYTAFHP